MTAAVATSVLYPQSAESETDLSPETKSCCSPESMKEAQDAFAAAERLKELFTQISPLIEYYIREVCAECREVCCRQKHAFPDERDILFTSTLGITVEVSDPERLPDEPCECLGPSGCLKPRWMRPFRCTWFFCEPLIRSMEEGPQKGYRRLIGMMGEMVRLYAELSTASKGAAS